MRKNFSFPQFIKLFPTDESCLEEIKKLRYFNGVFCSLCNKATIHYKITNRTAYACEFCRHQIYPLVGTIFEKTTTPLRIWFYAMFLMTHTKGNISIKQLQKELGITYKTAWQMFTNIKKLMAQNNGDLLSGTIEIDETDNDEKSKVFKWILFKKLEIRITQKEDPMDIKPNQNATNKLKR